MDRNEIVKKDVVDLLNQIMIRLRINDFPEPKIDKEYESDSGYDNIPTRFENHYSDKLDDKLSMIRTLVQAVLEELNSTKQYTKHDIEKMARAYYSSFCNA